MIRLVLARFVLLAVVVGLASACGGSDDSASPDTNATTSASETETTETESVPEEPTEDLGDFFTRRLDYEVKGQFGRSWDELHPGQQALVPRTKYEECRDEVSEQFVGVELESLRVIETYDDPIDALGVPEKTSTAVTVEVEVTQGSDSETFTDTFHAIAVDGRWVWVLPPADVRAFRNGVCPA
jgi:hypothetical protein